MTSQFPGALDNFTNPTSSDNLNTPAVLHSTQHANENDAIEAIEAWVGISGTSSQASHEYRIKQLEVGGGGGGGGIEQIGIYGQDEGLNLGTGTVLNFVGGNVHASISGSVIRVFVTGTPTGPDNFWTSGSGGQHSVIQRFSGADATGTYAVAVNQAFAGASGSFAENLGFAIGAYSHADGVGYAEGEGSHAEGLGSAFGNYSHAEGYGSAFGISSHAEGSASASGTYSHAEGNSTTYEESSHAEGGSIARGRYSHAEGYGETRGQGSHAEGTSTAVGDYSHAGGSAAISSGTASFAHGESVVANGLNSAALGGRNSVLSGRNSVILGGDGLAGTAPNTVYAPRLNIAQPSGSAPIANLGIDSNGFVVSGSQIVFPQEVIGIYGKDEGQNVGTGTILNVVGDNVSLSLSGSTLTLLHTNPAISFPQELIGIYGLLGGVPLGTGTWLDFGNNLTASLSGTVLRVDASAGQGTPFNGVDQIGMYGHDEGIPVGTGTILNVTGNRAVLSRSGTVLELNISPDPVEAIGVMGVNQGSSLGTGTTLSVTGSRLSMSLVGTTLNLISSPEPQDNIGVFGQYNATNLGTGTAIDFEIGMRAAITGTTLYVNPFGGTGSHGQSWVYNTGSAHLTSWKDDDYNIQFHIGDGTNVISTGSTSAGYAYVEVPVNSDIQSWAVYGDATGSIVTNVFKSTYAGFPPTSPLAGLGQPLMTNLRKNTGNATGTTSVNQGDLLLLSVSSVSTLTLATVALRARKTATS